MGKIKERTNAERENVVKPLKKWLESQNTKWETYMPPHPTSKGWDLEASRPNCDLLIEAKYIQRSFIASFSYLVTSPLPDRKQYFAVRKPKKWCAHHCWAIGSSNYKTRELYQLIFDYLIRCPTFWRHYKEDLGMKYVYFVINGKVAKVDFGKLLDYSETYKKNTAEKTTEGKRAIAEDLMKNVKYT
ncbi:MAG: hypothetical protein WC958_03655 [Dehalococcoidales bacterium]